METSQLCAVALKQVTSFRPRSLKAGLLLLLLFFERRALLEGRGGEGMILPFCLSPAEATSRALCPACALQYKRDVDILLQVQQRLQGQ